MVITPVRPSTFDAIRFRVATSARAARAPTGVITPSRSWLRTARAVPGIDTWLLGLFRLSEHLPHFALLLRRQRIVHLLEDDQRIRG